MKRLLLSLLFLSMTSCIHALHDPLLVIVIMIKDESPVIRQTLQPFVDAGLQHFFIFDTGSTDDTIAVTEAFFQEHGVRHGVIKQEPFVDFATSRNRALDLTEEAFPDACFMLMLDAEWYMHNVEGLIQFCESHQDEKWCDAYLVRLIMNGGCDFGAHRLIRCHCPTRFVGVVHEVFNWGGRNKVPDEVYFDVSPSRYGAEKSQRRYIRDSGLLLQEYERHPQDPRTAFYLAQTFECLGDWKNAATWYKYRAAMPGWDEENFMAYCRLGIAYEVLGKWDKALHHYLKAFCMRPHRIEPLVRLANHYWATGDYGLCFIFARRAAEMPYPHQDVLFVDKWMYDYGRYELLGKVAWYVGEYELGEQAIRQALKAHPNEPHLHSNLGYYMQRKQNTEAATTA